MLKYHFVTVVLVCRPREDSASFVQSEAKISRNDDENKEEEMMMNSVPSHAQTSSSNTRSHKTSSTAQNQRNSEHNLSASLGLSSDHRKGSGSTQGSGSKKRKEPEQDVQAEAADLDLSLEELESIMSEEMDEPLQAAANKKQCLESGWSSTAKNPQLPNQQKSKTNQHSIANNIQHLQFDRKGPAATNQGSERQLKRSSNQAQNSDHETHSLANGVKRPETDFKEEEVSFVVVRNNTAFFFLPFHYLQNS